MSSSSHAHPRARALLFAISALLVVATTLAGIGRPAGATVGVPVMIDNFSGTTLGTRTVTNLPTCCSTTTKSTFSQANGLGTTTMYGNGNTAGGTKLDYSPAAPVDLSSGGSNTQFFLEFQSIERQPVQQVGENAVSITITVTSQGGWTSTYQTGVANVSAFNVVLNFSCNGGPCFSAPQPDWAHITHVQVWFQYPRNLDPGHSTTIVLDTIRTTPTGGVVPPPAQPTVTAPPTAIAAAGQPVNFTVSFAQNGLPAAVTHTPTTDDGLVGSTLQISGTAPGTLTAQVSGGPTSYTVSVYGMTGDGTISVHVPANVVQDGWGTYNNASGSDPVVQFTLAVKATFTSATSATAIVGQPFSFNVTTTGGVPVPTIGKFGLAWPSGLNWADNGDGTATISGTPDAGSAGVYPQTFAASNLAGWNLQSFTLTVNQLPAITSASTATFSQFVSNTFTITTTGYPTPTITKQGSLPAFLSFTDNGNGTATISGTPPAGSGGVYPLTITAANGAGPNAQQNLTLTVTQGPTITSLAFTTFTVGTYGTFTITTAGQPKPAIGWSGTLPNGLGIVDNGDGTATVSGTPQAGAGGSYSILTTASNGIGSPASQGLNISVLELPAFTNASSAVFTLNQPNTFTFTTTGYPTTSLFLNGAPPAGLNFVDNGDGTATLSGTPTQAGVYPLSITPINGVGFPPDEQFTLTVAGPFSFTSIAPNKGATTGGTKSIIKGSGFTGATAVRFGATPAASFTVVDDNTINVTAPAHAPGLLNVTVIAPAGTNGNAMTSWYTFLAPGSISGVVNGNGHPLANMLVLVSASNAPVIAGSAITAADGTFTITGLAPGTYKLVVADLAQANGLPSYYYSQYYLNGGILDFNNFAGFYAATPIAVQSSATTTLTPMTLIHN